MDQLQARLGYRFTDPALLARALRHRSAGKDNNERLEFLGDAVLGLLVAELVSARLPSASEGELSRQRAALVQQATLAAIARNLRLGSDLALGPGELKSGGGNRESILADALEALIGAIYLDGGAASCAAIVRPWFEARLPGDATEAAKDAKTRLQELLQSRRSALPVYEISEISGKEHEQTFVVTCRIALLPAVVRGMGSSRKLAEQNAAEAALAQLGAAM